MQTAPSPTTDPRTRHPLDARMFFGRSGRALRAALAVELPLSLHARRRLSRGERAIPAELVQLVIRYGRASDQAFGVRLSLDGAAPPTGVSKNLWQAALPVIVPIDEHGRIPIVFRRSCQ